MGFPELLTRAAQINPKGLATLHAGRSQNWETLAARTRSMAAGLRHHGVDSGDHIGIAAANGDGFLQAFLAISWTGAVAAPINLRLAAPEVIDQINDSATSFLLCDAAGAALLAPLLDRLVTVQAAFYLDEAGCPAGFETYPALFSHGECQQPVPRLPDDAALLKYTGGTTGRAKGVQLSNRNVTFVGLSALAGGPFDETDKWLIVIPMFHAGVVAPIASVMLAAGTLYFLNKFIPVECLQILSSQRITRCGMTPTMIKALLDHPDFPQHDLSHLRGIIYGGAPMPVPVLTAMLEKLPHVKLLQSFGQTESMAAGTLLLEKYHTPSSPKLRSAGQAAAGVNLQIVDAQNNALPPNAVGEICIQGDCVMLGYLNRPEQTAQALAGGWLHTGDAGYLDDEGFLFIVDRLKDMIITGGENVFCAEVENAIYSFPHVAECAVFGVTDEKWGERVHAEIRFEPGHGATELELIEHCRTRIASYKCPKSISFRDKPMPLTPMGKIRKTDLRAAFNSA